VAAVIKAMIQFKLAMDVMHAFEFSKVSLKKTHALNPQLNPQYPGAGEWMEWDGWFTVQCGQAVRL
jgi:hypothetical protein